MIELPFNAPGRPYYLFKGAGTKLWLLPTQRKLRRTAVALYTPLSFKGRSLKKLMYWGIAAKVTVDEQVLSDLEQRFAGVLGEKEVRLAFYKPVRPDRRILLVMNPAGDLLGFAREAGAEARHALDHEQRILHDLQRMLSLKDQVPVPLALFDHDESSFLVVSAGSGPRGPSEWGELHHDFVNKLHSATQNIMPLAESPGWRWLTEELERIRAHLTSAWLKRYSKVLPELEPFKNTPVPMALAHGDFTPWNTRVRGGALFVFDWEHAQDAYYPNYDYFHFQFVTAVSLGQALTPEKASAWVASAPVQTAIPNSILLLAYLLTITAFYQQGVAEDDFVETGILKGVGQLLDGLTA